MQLAILLWGLSKLLWFSSIVNKRFRKFISKASVSLMIRTEDGRYARLFVFDKGKVSSKTGSDHPFDAALVWSDPQSGFSVLLKQNMEAIFYAAAEGKMRIEGMNAHALWFNEAVARAMWA